MPATVESPPISDRARASAPVRFHISLNASNLDAAVAFYRVLLGVPPAKCYPDYAKFEMADPPLVLSLEPQPHATGGALNHLGLRVPDAAALIEIQRRLESAGIATNREEGVECCYARQTKFWVRDPDRNLWEVYVLEADTDHRGPASASAAPAQSGANDHGTTGQGTSRKGPAPPAKAPPGDEIAWEHQLGQPFPASIPIADGKADRVLLRGTFNEPLAADEQERILREARRVLRLGGRVIVHGLGADIALNGQATELPGPAAAVKHVPAQADLLDAVRSAGFCAVRLAKLSPTAVLRHQGIGLREVLIEGIKLDSTPFDLRQVVLYQGPMRELTDDFGNVFRRGQRTTIGTPAVEALRTGPLAESFVFFPPGGEK